MALLNAAVRRQLVALAQDGVRVEGQCLRIEVPIEQHRAPAELAANARRCLQLVDALCVRLEDVRARFAGNVQSERSGETRRLGLELFLRSFGKAPEREALVELGLGDSAPEVRLVTASALGPESARAQAVLAALVGDARVEAETRLAALKALGPLTDAGELPAEVDAALGLALGSGHVELQRVAATIAGRGRVKVHVPHLLVLASASRSGAQAEALRALAVLADASVEARLWGALRSSDAEVAGAAAFALGKLGTLAAVPRLRALIDGWDASTSAKSRAREAIGLIQARHGLGDGGALSLAAGGDPTGALSVAAEGGRVAVAPVEAGALATAPEAGSGTGPPAEAGVAGEAGDAPSQSGVDSSGSIEAGGLKGGGAVPLRTDS